MEIINQDISTGQFHKAYLLYGDEAYLRTQYRNRLIRALVQEGDTMNFTRFEGDNIDVGEIIDLAETMPFFADHRVILLVGSNLFKSSNEQMATYLESVAESTIFIFDEENVDKRSKTYKAITKAGYASDFSMPNERVLIQWIGGKLKKMGKTMAKEAWPEFYSRAGESMDLMDREFEKLVMYCWDKERIEKADVEAVCTKQLQSQIFDMINAIALKDPTQVLAYYHDMLAMKEPPMRILVMIERSFMRMLSIREMTAEHISDRDIAKKLGVRDFVIAKDRRLSRNFSTDQMRKLLEDAADIETRVKTGRMGDQMAVELLMLQYAK